MSAYTDHDLALVPVPGGWIAMAPLRWEIGFKGSALFVVVPPDFLSDGPSVPAILRWAFNPNEPAFQKAARVHDWLLTEGWSGLTAGAEFAAALKADGVPAFRRFLMWLAVSLWKWA